MSHHEDDGLVTKTRDSYFIRWWKLCEACGLPRSTTAEALIARIGQQSEEIERLSKRVNELEAPLSHEQRPKCLG